VISLTAEEAAAALEVTRVAQPVPGVATDTRTLKPGDLFVALRGETHDGHSFVATAFAAGASGAVVESGADLGVGSGEGQGLPTERLYRVPDGRVALGALARAVRRKSAARVLAVTGSVGKTGTKDLLRAAAERSGSVIATEANQNNEVGVPLTLLRLLSLTEVAVVEMGMRGRGQILELGRIAEPDVGLVTKIAPVHLELVGDLAGVAAVKGELFRALRPGGVAVIPADEPLLEEQVERAGRRVVRFCYGGCADAEVTGRATHVSESGSLLEVVWPEGEVEVEVPFSGRHRLENAVAALAACYAAGLPVAACAEGLPDAVFTPLRGDEYRVGDVVVVDDSYNANPTAIRLALDDLVRRARDEKGRPVAVLGDMLELGPESRRYHREIGAYAAAVGVRSLIGVGPLSEAMVDGFGALGGDPSAGRGRDGLHRADLESGLSDIVACIRPGDVVLVKGSRAMRLERVVAELRRAGGGGGVADESAVSGGGT
jgi:UDP-N-acetylmuramoyl-tripeptide--D-alanyl-D-alanine ligase